MFDADSISYTEPVVAFIHLYIICFIENLRHPKMKGYLVFFFIPILITMINMCFLQWDLFLVKIDIINP